MLEAELEDQLDYSKYDYKNKQTKTVEMEDHLKMYYYL
jgi:hypothetical protein